MSIVIADNIRETCISPGTGPVSLLGAVAGGYFTFSSACADGSTVFYTIRDQSGNNVETGQGTYNATPNTITRTAGNVFSGTHGAGVLVNFASGIQYIYMTVPAAMTQLLISILNVALGGTGLNSITAHNLLIGNGTSAANLLAPSATSGVPLISKGTTLDPAYGTAVVAGGGTGRTLFGPFDVICGGTTTTGPLQFVSSTGTSNQILSSQGAGALPTWKTLTITIGSTAISGGSANGGILWDNGTFEEDALGNFVYDQTGAIQSGGLGSGTTLYIGDVHGGVSAGVLALYDVSVPSWIGLSVQNGQWYVGAPGNAAPDNNGTLNAASIIVNSNGGMTFTGQTSGAGTHTGTLTNAPATGNPAFWIPVEVNNTTYYIPAWS